MEGNQSMAIGAHDELGQRVSDYWSTQRVWQPGEGTQWLELEAVQRRIAAKVSGDPAVDWLEYVATRHYAHRQPVARCLSLGCGEGGLERTLALRGFFVHCDAYDIAEGSIKLARQSASNMGLDSIAYKVADVNRLQLPPASYDAIFVHSALHHFSNLEGVYSQIHHALKADAFLACNEYIGPTRFQFPRRQVEAMNIALALLPIRYRRYCESVNEPVGDGQPPVNKFVQTIQRFEHLIRRGRAKIQEGALWPTVRRKLREVLFSRLKSPDGARYKLEVACPTVNDVVTLDPSEAIRSEEILPLMQNEFEIIEVKGYGGSLLQFLLAGIAGNFASDDPVSKSLLQMLFQIEDSLIATGDLQHDFAVIVARAR
jgi:2-polyprenyl-3-methyl-5-hydroxy-6-metoxy-1,4-benzoquinol methylase